MIIGHDDEPQYATALDRKMALLPGVSARKIIHEYSWWICHEMTCTSQSRARLKEWATLGCPRDDGLRGMGSRPILYRAQRLLSSLPEPVRWYLSNFTYIVAAGCESMAGWMGPQPVLLGARICALSRDDESLILHEFAHGFLHGSDEPSTANLVYRKREQARFGLLLFAAHCADDKNIQEKTAEYYQEKADTAKLLEVQANALVTTWKIMLRKRKESEGIK